MAASAVFSMSLAYCSTYNLTPAIVPVLIGRYLSFARPRDHCAVTSVKNVRQLNARRRKKAGFRLSHRQPLGVRLVSEKYLIMLEYF